MVGAVDLQGFRGNGAAVDRSRRTGRPVCRQRERKRERGAKRTVGNREETLDIGARRQEELINMIKTCRVSPEERECWSVHAYMGVLVQTKGRRGSDRQIWYPG